LNEAKAEVMNRAVLPKKAKY